MLCVESVINGATADSPDHRTGATGGRRPELPDPVVEPAEEEDDGLSGLFAPTDDEEDIGAATPVRTVLLRCEICKKTSED